MTQNPLKFQFVSEKDIKASGEILLNKRISAVLRVTLKKGTYWLQPTYQGKVFWNATLLQSYLVHGEESHEHLALLAEFSESLPKAGQNT